MAKITKHIISYLTIFSLLFSSLGITIYYHHCNKEKITLKSISGKIKCNHQAFDNNDEKINNACCRHSDGEHESSEPKEQNDTPIDELTLDQVSCCVDSQVTKQLNNEFLNNTKQKISDKELVKDNQKEKSELKNDIISKTKDYLNKKIISPIKKFISLLRQLSKLAYKSDSDSYSL